MASRDRDSRRWSGPVILSAGGALCAVLLTLAHGETELGSVPRPASTASSRPTLPALEVKALEELIRRSQSLPLPQRITLISGRFIGVPYATSPLGEGPGRPPDIDPRFTVARFDCTTYVETVLALSLARDFAEARRLLDVIRYSGGKVGFVTRKHFPMAQWIPENAAAGFLEDVTRRVGGARTKVARKRLDAEVWARRRTKILPELADDQIPKGIFELPIIPIGEVAAIADQIPDGAVINIVRADYKSVPVRVSHQGFVIRERGRILIRHALLKGYGRVVDTPLVRYLERVAKYGKWPVVGINLLVPKQPPELDRLLDRDRR